MVSDNFLNGDTINVALTIRKIKEYQHQEKQYKVSDGRGLYLLVTKSGKYFRMNYRFNGKQKTLALGVWPDVSLEDARDACNEARKKIKDGIDPLAKQQKKDLFFEVAQEWFATKVNIWSDKHAMRVWRRLELNVFPWLQDRSIDEITAQELLGVLRRIEARQAYETAHRMKQACGQIFRYAIVTGRAQRDVSQDLQGALIPIKPKHRAAIVEPSKVAFLMQSINEYTGHYVTQCALKVIAHTFVRTAELRGALWSEVDLDGILWKIPSKRMKMDRPHMVPLSTQVQKILKDLHPYSSSSKYVFPSIWTHSKPLSENTILFALRRMGFTKEEMTGHGFRGMASTLLHENGFPSHLIELQLAHVEGNKTKGAYNHALYLDDRVKMMQWYSDYLASLT